MREDVEIGKLRQDKAAGQLAAQARREPARQPQSVEADSFPVGEQHLFETMDMPVRWTPEPAHKIQRRGRPNVADSQVTRGNFAA